ncbi:MAG: hypothetical protein NVV70_14405 [Cellulomonas sp.]|uniref:Uncharacterized protein n=1 Tax=Cellulomonas gelida TaxID=1712 RepID=A0A4Y3KME6_9CELL|nr:MULTISPECIES: hypothetical protein [Cellulomonas]KMM44416.1 hypothetical protein CWIS_16405 [Cellulomonas sp. A375-1]MCR6649265.1 hypothetical protein [Cellulomonas sp.]MCR6705251.1 hypothetical protein [Cellulomonas sp.]GEA84140.1 hypothetical protein CGE01nite_13910 [Cellulomonas gelida]GGL19810.1 hypothetical protein GCM10009774_07560 [Cellulomonas gelida]
MTEMPDPEMRLEAVLGAREAMAGAQAPDADVLEAVEAGLLSVAGGALNWGEIPHQRPRPLG